MKRTRLKPVSAKTAKLKRETNPKRAAYVKEKCWCEVCDILEPLQTSNGAVECHEVLRGRFRSEAIKYRACWLAVCRFCHEELGDYSKWPIARQLAIKLLSDPEHFDIKRIQDIRDDHLVEMADVARHLRLMESP